MFKPFDIRKSLCTAATCLALVPGASLAQDANPFDFATMTPDQKAAFGAAVRDYIMSDPQIVMDAVEELERINQIAEIEEDKNLVADNMDALLNDGYSFVGGNPDGDITVVEFLDYRCGFCRRAHPEVEALIAQDGNIRLIVKEFPILGEASMASSRFAIATHIVAGDEAYKAVNEGLIALEGDPAEPQLRRLASTLGLEADAILAEMGSEEVTRRIAETRELARTMRINGTPSFVFGNQMLRGYAPLEAMQQIVAEERS